MPWSPIPKFPEIVQHLKMKGYSKEVPFMEIKKAIMIKTGTIKEQTIKGILIAMEELDFIKNLGNGFFLIDPQKWKKEEIKKEEQDIDKRLNELDKK